MVTLQNYQCPACGGGLTFDAQSGKVRCEYCNSVFDIKEIETLYAAQEKPEAQSQEHSQAQDAPADGESAQWDTSHLSEDWGDATSSLKMYNCPSCGANIMCEQTTAATSCPYCGNPTVIGTLFTGALKPDYIIPFKVDKKGAINALKRFYEHKPLLPSNFASQNHLEETQALYVPFWFFDGQAYAEALFNTTTKTSVQTTEGTDITINHYDCHRAGFIDFKMIPVDASKKMNDDLMDSIEPYDYTEIQTFSTAYLPGFMADIHDVSAEECFERANARCEDTCISALRSTVSDKYDSCSVARKKVVLKQGRVSYGLLPVYLLNTKCEDKKYVFAVNGQTGKVVGDLPISKGKAVLSFLMKLVIGFIIGGIASYGLYFLNT